MIAFIIVFTIINISLWGIFLFKFKKIFSTDSIIEKTKRQVDLIINDMDQNDNRDISVLNETLRKIKISLNESEKQMELFKEASNRLKTLISEADKKARSDSNSIIYNDLDSRSAKKVNTRYSDAYSNTSKKVSINPDAAYQVTKKGLTRNVCKQDKITETLICNMISLLKELEENYKDNIEIK